MSHPYEAFEADPLWRIVSNAIRDLVMNGMFPSRRGGSTLPDTLSRTSVIPTRQVLCENRRDCKTFLAKNVRM